MTARFVVLLAGLASIDQGATFIFKVKDNKIMGSKSAVNMDESVVSAVENNSLIFVFNITDVANITDIIEEDDAGTWDSEEILTVWYLLAYGCLVLFFLVAACTELFFGNPMFTWYAEKSIPSKDINEVCFIEK